LSLGHRAPRPQALLDAIEAEVPVSFEGDLWRVVREGRDPLQPSRAGGRWDDSSFDTLYTSSERDGAIAEAWFHAARGQPIPPSKPGRRVHRIEARLARVLDLSASGLLASFGVDMSQYGRLSYFERGGEYPTTQQIGEAAFFYEFEAIVVPNARWPTSNVVILTENAPMRELSADVGEVVDLAAWRAAIKTTR
jgi:RES domain-containing protein